MNAFFLGSRVSILIDLELCPPDMERHRVLRRLEARLLGAFGEPRIRVKVGETIWRQRNGRYLFTLRAARGLSPSMRLGLVRSGERWGLTGRWLCASHPAPLNLYVSAIRWLVWVAMGASIIAAVRYAIVGEATVAEALGFIIFVCVGFGLWQWVLWLLFRWPLKDDEDRLLREVVDAVAERLG